MSAPRLSPGFRLGEEVRALVPRTIEIRRDLHRHPELGFQETRTAARVAEELLACGIEVTTGVARTGVVGLLRGARPGKTLLLRADMDALPLPEENAVEYRSSVAGAMHACGHDGHVAMLLTAARALAARRAELSGAVKLVFQPAEEGPGGARPMIEQGVLRDPPVDAAVGIHLWNETPVGRLGVGTGPVMAAADEFEVVIEGVGGHGAYPHRSVDPVLAAAHVVTALQSVVSRNVGPLDSAVVSVGMIQAGYAFNIIPRTATLVGTLRSYKPEIREQLARRVREVAEGVAAGLGARSSFRLKTGYPPTVNDAATAAFVAEVAEGVFGPGQVFDPEPSMGGEDMSYYLDAVPGAFLFLGSSNPDRGLEAPHHSPLFDFDEAALPAGAETFLRVALAYLR